MADRLRTLRERCGPRSSCAPAGARPRRSGGSGAPSGPWPWPPGTTGTSRRRRSDVIGRPPPGAQRPLRGVRAPGRRRARGVGRRRRHPAAPRGRRQRPGRAQHGSWRSSAAGADLLFGPYGSGPGGAVAAAMAGRPEVIWNHGAAAVPRTGARLVDVLRPRRALLAGAARGAPAGDRRGSPWSAPGGFGRRSPRARARPCRRPGPSACEVRSRPRRTGAAVAAALSAAPPGSPGAGRMEDDLALARRRPAGLRAALVVMRGVGRRATSWARRSSDCIGPVRWDGDAPRGRSACRGADYPAAQAAAAPGGRARLAARGLGGARRAVGGGPALRTTTPLGPFAIDDEGRQVAHSPAIVRWEPGPRGPERVVVWRPPHPDRVTHSRRGRARRPRR